MPATWPPRAVIRKSAGLRTIESALQKLGFDVTTEANRDLKRMRRALEDFRDDAAGADVALIYFSGHGVEIAGDNRLLPVDADPSSMDRLKATTLPLEEVRETVTAVGKIGLVVLDACRNDPFGQSGESNSGEGRGVSGNCPPTRGKGAGALGGVHQTAADECRLERAASSRWDEAAGTVPPRIEPRMRIF